MGISIDLFDYEIKTLWKDFLKVSKIEHTVGNYEKFIFVLKLHGKVIDDRFIILNNEFWEDYNRWYQIKKSFLFAFELLDKQYLYDEDGDPIDYVDDEVYEDMIWEVDTIFDNKPQHVLYKIEDIEAGDIYDILAKIEEYKKENEEKK